MSLKFVVLSLAALLIRVNCGVVGTDGKRFVADQKPLCLIGFDAVWMMHMASDPSSQDKVVSAFQEATKSGMNIARTRAFSISADRALQTSPGVYNEDMLKGLDFLISEAGKNGVYLILSLVNNWKVYGAKKQYSNGQTIKNDNEFFTSSVTKGYYKDHVKAVLTRKNTRTGVAYKDDPTIFARELVNEHRCESEPSGETFERDSKEGLDGQSKHRSNPGGVLLGVDFISNNQVPPVDFAKMHVDPEYWLPKASEADQTAFVDKWVQAHIQDSNTILNMPIILGEFGKLSKSAGYSVAKRDSYFGMLYDAIYASSSNRGSCAGGLFWWVFAQGMDSLSDGYEVILD
ncbi:hypothetical protein ACJRO7_006426 [Eucalyptus globulus]|uniref:mannan endo-1,4-beta-mannosidase n=1 Tax=Eucalyptus globulus TaxID=34317 RepID=A0ABD3IHP6_EUCGL